MPQNTVFPMQSDAVQFGKNVTKMTLVEILLAGLCTVSDGDANALPLTERTTLQFAAVEQGQAALRRRDQFIQSLSRFDKQSRLSTAAEVSTDEFLNFASSHVLTWEPGDQDKLRHVIETIRPRMSRFHLPFPETIQLVKTSGKEEGGAAYCRGNAIILPSNVLRRSEAELERLLTHELFHVLSGFNPMLREKLYAIVGFKPCGTITLPPTLVDRKITNPDAPTIDFAVTLTDGDVSRQAVPILFASVKNYDPTKGEGFFRFMQFRLMVVKNSEGRIQPLLRDGKPQLIDARHLPDYLDQIGRNTNYIIHPEEILADNFVHLINGESSLPTPRIVEEMRRLLTLDP